MNKKLIIASACAAALVLCIILGVYVFSNGFLSKKVTAEIEIPYGTGAYRVIEILKENEVIKSEFMMKRVYNRRAKKENIQFQSGRVTLNSKMSYNEIVDILSSTLESDFTLTVPEGYEISQIVPLISETCGISEDELYGEISGGEFDYAFITPDLPQGNARLEGYLYPETYFVSKTDSAHDIINMMLAEFGRNFTSEYAKRADEMNYTVHEIITLASIIEKECSADRDVVSSVFHNRLSSSDFLYLESCATVIYVTKQPRDRLTYEDINVDSPYNTYINTGLPPGPIASPGIEAIKAALYPADTDYYYFSAVENGLNTFSKTYEEHLQKN